LASTIKRTWLVAQAKEVRVNKFLFVDVEAMSLPLDWANILLEYFSAEVGHG
jgi:hypothetical protein